MTTIVRTRRGRKIERDKVLESVLAGSAGRSTHPMTDTRRQSVYGELETMTAKQRRRTLKKRRKAEIRAQQDGELLKKFSVVEQGTVTAESITTGTFAPANLVAAPEPAEEPMPEALSALQPASTSAGLMYGSIADLTPEVAAAVVTVPGRHFFALDDEVDKYRSRVTRAARKAGALVTTSTSNTSGEKYFLVSVQ